MFVDDLGVLRIIYPRDYDVRLPPCACKSNISFAKSVKVAGKAKQIDLLRNTDCRERSNLLDVCIFNLTKKNSSIFAGAQRYCFKLACVNRGICRNILQSFTKSA